MSEENKIAERNLEALEATPKVVERTLGPKDNRRTYQQKPLSFMRKAQLGALLSKLLQRTAQESGQGVLNELIYTGTNIFQGNMEMEDAAREAENVIMTIAALGSWGPQFIAEFYLIVLNVPKNQQEWFLKQVEENEDDGGFSDEESIDIFRTFYLQNKDRFAELFKLATGFLSKPVANQTQSETTTGNTDLQ